MKKRCFECEEIKDISYFYKHKEMADGHLNKCKECIKVSVKKNRKDNIEYYRQYDRDRAMLDHRVKARIAYSNTDAGKESAARAAKRYRNENPIKYKAQTAVRNAVSNGLLVKPSLCESCSSSDNVLHGHHDDYSKPLDVRWLCPSCHTDWHRNNGSAING